MANIWEKDISILAGNLNAGLSYLITTVLGKGQLITKCLLGIFNSPKKTNEKIQLYYGTSSRIVFVRFLGELKTPKRHFEINWPLVVSKTLFSWIPIILENLCCSVKMQWLIYKIQIKSLARFFLKIVYIDSFF